MLGTVEKGDRWDWWEWAELDKKGRSQSFKGTHLHLDEQKHIAPEVQMPGWCKEKKCDNIVCDM